jgi:Zn-dependent protease with chaperone function
MKNLKLRLSLLACLLVVPVLGIIIGNLVSYSYEKKYEETVIEFFKEKRNVDLSNNQAFIQRIKLDNMCSSQNIDPAYTDICNEYNSMNYLSRFSALTLLFVIAIFIAIKILGIVSRKRRTILFYIFRPGLLISQLSTVLLVISSSGILIYSIYLAESYYLNRIHVGIIISVVMAAFIGVVKICIIALKPVKDIQTVVYGKSLPRDTYPSIWNFVESITNKLDTKMPNNIVVGLDPTFFVTESKIVCVDGELQGKSLFLSLPFCRVITQDELAAIIGHELGHFIGEDTKWSQKFYPIYRGASETISVLYSPSNSNVAFLPAVMIMASFVESFEKIEKEISRERELNADKVGQSISSAKNMATALLKVHIYQHVWEFTKSKMVESLKEGMQLVNSSAHFLSVCESLPSNFMENEIGQSHTSHPTDTHPPLSVRLTSLEVPLSTIYADGIKVAIDKKAIDLIENYNAIESELSVLEHHKLVKIHQINTEGEVQAVT